MNAEASMVPSSWRTTYGAAAPVEEAASTATNATGPAIRMGDERAAIHMPSFEARIAAHWRGRAPDRHAANASADADRVARQQALTKLVEHRPSVGGAVDAAVLVPREELELHGAGDESHPGAEGWSLRSEEHTSELQSLRHLVCRLLLEKKKR